MSGKTEDLFLVFDGGTQSMRSGLIDVNGISVDFVKLPIQPYFSEHKGWAEQRPEYYWEKLCEASKQLLGSNSGLLKNIKAVAVTAQRGTYINLDKDGNALRPAITWLDERMTDKTRWAPFWLEAATKAIGIYGRVDDIYRRCYSNWIRLNQPEIWDKTHKYLLHTAYFHYKLTGNFVESLGSNFGYLPINGKTYRWAEKKNDLRRILFPIEDSKLPDLVRPGETIGSISKQVCKETGIPEGVPVVAAACDKSCEVLGAGCMTPDVPCLSFGTCSTIDTVTDYYTELKPLIAPYPAAVYGYYVNEISVPRGFWMVSWFKDEFGLQEQKLAKESNIMPEKLLDDMARGVPPGSKGLVLQPYWMPFYGVSGAEGKGSIIGFSDVHGRAQLYRAVLEGIIYALKEGADITTAKLKKPFSKVRASGGGAQSDLVLQITADVFGLPVERPLNPETSALGAAMNAAVGLGYYPDYSSAIRGMTGIDKSVEPIARNMDIYAALYNRVYRKMYDRVGPLFKELQEISDMFPEEMK